MIVAPTTRTGTPDISALFPADNASAAMGYVMQSFGQGDSSDFARFESILREPSVAARLLARPDYPRRPGPGAALGPRAGAGFGHAGAARRLADRARLDVEPVGQPTRLKRVTFRHPDPVFAAQLLQALYDSADTLIRDELEARTAKRIAYLNKRCCQKEPDPDHRRALTKLLMDQEQIAMVLAVHEPFAAQMAEPPAAGPKAAWPRKIGGPAGLRVHRRAARLRAVQFASALMPPCFSPNSFSYPLPLLRGRGQGEGDRLPKTRKSVFLRRRRYPPLPYPLPLTRGRGDISRARDNESSHSDIRARHDAERGAAPCLPALAALRDFRRDRRRRLRQR